jgi:hypothetical protein
MNLQEVTARAVVVNESPAFGRVSWFDVAVPYDLASQLPAVCQVVDRGWLAVRCRALGYHSVIYHVRGRLVAAAVHDLVLAPPGVDYQLAFRASPWVVDELASLPPELHVVVGGKHYYSRPRLQLLQRTHDCPAMQRWHARARLDDSGLLYDVWADVYSDQDVVELAGAVTFSDPQKPDMQVLIESAELVCADPVVLDSAPAFGFGSPVRRDDGTWTVQLVAEPVVLGDGQQIPYWGAALCLPAGVPLSVLLLNADPAIRERIEALHARAQGRAHALSRDWAGAWLLFGEVPILTAEARNEVEKLAARRAALRTDAHWLFQPRPLGQPPRAGQTGGQEDFGATKGTAMVAAGDLRPDLIDLYRWCLGEVLRPVHLREVDGSTVARAAHPEWVSYNQRTHFHAGVSPDRLGKPHPEPWSETHGWTGKDNQHESANLIAALYAVTGDPLAEQAMRDELEHSIARQDDRPDSPRGQGRSIASLAQRWLLLGDERAWVRLCQIASWARLQSPGLRFVGIDPLSVRVLATLSDRRALVDPITGEPLECWAVWEHGLAAIGYCGALEQVARRGRLSLPVEPDDLRALEHGAWQTCATLVRHGYYHDGERWRLCSHVRYPLEQGLEGAPIPAARYGEAGWTTPDAGFWSWCIGAVRWVRNRVASGERGPLTEAEAAVVLGRAASILDQDAREPGGSLQELEWRAVGE